jgi:hypothetical protein
MLSDPQCCDRRKKEKEFFLLSECSQQSRLSDPQIPDPVWLRYRITDYTDYRIIDLI